MTKLIQPKPTRRTALKTLAGAGAAASLPLWARYADAQSAAPIKVGFQVHRTGIGAAYGRWYDRTTQAAAKVINEAGGINGRPIEIVAEDDGTDPKRGAEVVEKFANQHGCDIAFGTLFSHVVYGSAPAAGELVITELQPDPDAVADETGEWFEVLNLSAGAVDLSGCELADQGTDSHTIVGSVVVEPGAYAVLGRSESTNGGVTLDYVYGTDISLGNSGDELAIRCAGALIDEVVYLGSWPFGAGTATQLDASAGAANDDVGQWCEATAVYGDGDLGTPGSANGAC